MKTFNSKTLHLNFNSHMKPLSLTEKETLVEGVDNYGNTTERIRSFIMKLLFSN